MNNLTDEELAEIQTALRSAIWSRNEHASVYRAATTKLDRLIAALHTSQKEKEDSFQAGLTALTLARQTIADRQKTIEFLRATILELEEKVNDLKKEVRFYQREIRILKE